MIQLIVLLVSIAMVIVMAVAGSYRTRSRLAAHVVFALVAATLVNLGTDLLVARGAVLGVVCVVAAIGMLAVPLMWGRAGARSGGDHER